MRRPSRHALLTFYAPRLGARGWVTVVSMAALSACGGGGGGGSEDSAAKPSGGQGTAAYVGNWASDCQFSNSSASWRVSAVITKLASDRLKSVVTSETFPTADCTGSAIGRNSDTFEVSYTGTKVADGKTVDKFVWRNTTNNFEDKSISLIDGNKLYSDDGYATVDADGYPNTLDPTFWLNKL